MLGAGDEHWLALFYSSASHHAQCHECPLMGADRRIRPRRRPANQHDRSSASRAAAPARWPAGKLRRLLDEHPAFQVLTVDGLNWIDPFSGGLVSAPFEVRDTALAWLLEHQPWRKHAEPHSTDRVHILRWIYHLREAVPNDARYRHFLSGGRWLNPYTGTIEHGIAPIDGRIGRRTMQAMAACLIKHSNEATSQLLSAGELEQRVRTLDAQPQRPARSTSGPLAVPASGGRLSVRPDGTPAGTTPTPPVHKAIITDTTPGGVPLLQDGPTAGTLVEGYRVIERLGEGGMGSVYRAEQVSLERTVALKVLQPRHSESEAFAQRFLREAQVAASINHANVVTVYDVGRHQDRLYMTMELLEGGDARELTMAAGGRLRERVALAIARDAALGLAALHEAGVIHRDIKPGNLFLDEQRRAKIGDLGLARDASHSSHLTVSGATVGTPAFMAPEQVTGAPLTPAIDCYSLGASLYFLLCGKPPHEASNVFAVIRRIVHDPPPDVHAANPAVRAATAEVLMRAMAKDPETRLGNARVLAEQLDELLNTCPDLDPARPEADTVRVKRSRLGTGAYPSQAITTVLPEPSGETTRTQHDTSIEEQQAAVLLTRHGWDHECQLIPVDHRDLSLTRTWPEQRVLFLLLTLPPGDSDAQRDERTLAADQLLDACHGRELASEVAERLRAVLGDDTAVMALIVDPANGEADLATLAVEPPMIANLDDGVYLRSLPCEGHWHLAGGDTVIAWSRGAGDAFDEHRRSYLPRGLASDLLSCADQTVGQVTTTLTDALRNYVADAVPPSDATLLVLRRLA